MLGANFEGGGAAIDSKACREGGQVCVHPPRLRASAAGNHLITNAFWLLCGLLDERVAGPTECSPDTALRLFWFAVSWSLAGTLEPEDRDRYDMFVRSTLRDLPGEDTAWATPPLQAGMAGTTTALG